MLTNLIFTALFYVGIGNVRMCRMIVSAPEDFEMTCYALRFRPITVMAVEILLWPISMVLR